MSDYPILTQGELNDLRLKIAYIKGWKWYQYWAEPCPNCQYRNDETKSRYIFTDKIPGANWKECPEPDIHTIDYWMKHENPMVLKKWPETMMWAGELLEEMQKKCRSVKVQIYPNTVTIQVYVIAGAHPTFMIIGETLPVAICSAYILMCEKLQTTPPPQSAV